MDLDIPQQKGRASHPLFILDVYSPAISAILLVLRHTGTQVY